MFRLLHGLTEAPPESGLDPDPGFDSISVLFTRFDLSYQETERESSVQNVLLYSVFSCKIIP